MINIAQYIDHTVLKPTCTSLDIKKLCNEAAKHNFAAVCVPPNFVKLAVEYTVNTDVKIATVVGFPFGYSTTAAKIAEIEQALKDGADEIDLVHNISAVKEENWDLLATEINLCLQPVRLHNKCMKVIIESSILTDGEIIKSCELYAKHKVDFVKTSTGYAEGGASVYAVSLMREHLPENIQIKASGGIKNYKSAKELVAAGATRIGASAGVSIVNEEAKLAL